MKSNGELYYDAVGKENRYSAGSHGRNSMSLPTRKARQPEKEVRKSTIEDARGSTDFLEDNANDDDSVELIGNRELRLQKLLGRMDKIVTTLHNMMTPVIAATANNRLALKSCNTETANDEMECQFPQSASVEESESASCSSKEKDIVDPSPSHQPKLLTGGNLRDYQLGGVEWMLSLFANGLNGILAE